MDCRPAITRMNVKPRFAQMLVMLTASSAVSGSLSRPGSLSTSKGSMLARMPTDGWNRYSHISDATATDVATVLEKMLRNAPIPRTCLSARIASPNPRRSPIGTVISANWTVVIMPWNSFDSHTSRYCDQPT